MRDALRGKVMAVLERLSWRRRGSRVGHVALVEEGQPSGQSRQGDPPPSALAMACFIEELEPEALPLSEEASRQAREGLYRLNLLPPLQAFTDSLERLSRSEEGVLC